MRRPTWLHVQEDVREAVAANSETLVEPLQKKGHCEGDSRGQARGSIIIMGPRSTIWSPFR
jgi:hypothetical protein